MWLILYVDTHVHLSYYYPTAVVYSLNAIVTGHGRLGSAPPVILLSPQNTVPVIKFVGISQL